MPLEGQVKQVTCLRCGRKVTLVFGDIDMEEWSGICKCGERRKEIEGEPTKYEGQV